ncbi:50S ribosomal protein L11 [Candidatus Woesearchaeota archaeon]|nr:50S ribosomal protein L11 [Candidatus Woesearchaeota archaeon]
MAKETVEALVEGGKATAAPPLGPALGPMGVNIGQVVAKINEVTANFKGMQVPVKVIIDKDTKEFSIEVGTPPASALIKKEAQVEKGAANPLQEKIADLLIEQIIKIAKMKESGLLGKDLKARVKEIIGTCNSMGIMVEGVPAVEAIKLVNEGKFDEEIRTEKTELSAEEIKKLAEEKKKLQEEMEKRREEFMKTAKELLATMEGLENNKKRSKLMEAKIPLPIVNELVPEEKEAAPAAGGK